MRFLLLALASVALAACATRPAAYEEPLPRGTYQKINVTAYLGASADGRTARGTRYQTREVASAAADWSRWPAGTQFRVLATGEFFEVDDFTDDIVGTNTILLYKPSSPPNAPARNVTIEILRWGSPRDSAALLQPQKSSTAKKILAALLARYPDRR